VVYTRVVSSHGWYIPGLVPQRGVHTRVGTSEWCTYPGGVLLPLLYPGGVLLPLLYPGWYLSQVLIPGLVPLTGVNTRVVSFLPLYPGGVLPAVIPGWVYLSLLLFPGWVYLSLLLSRVEKPPALSGETRHRESCCTRKSIPVSLLVTVLIGAQRCSHCSVLSNPGLWPPDPSLMSER